MWRRNKTAISTSVAHPILCSVSGDAVNSLVNRRYEATHLLHTHEERMGTIFIASKEGSRGESTQEKRRTVSDTKGNTKMNNYIAFPESNNDGEKLDKTASLSNT